MLQKYFDKVSQEDRRLIISAVAGCILLGFFWSWCCISNVKTKIAPRKFVICIDPGHPTKFNSGMRLQHGVSEMNMDWLVACELEKLLSNDNRFIVYKTRNDKYLVMSNPERAVFANGKHADLLLRLHCDAGPSMGYTVYYPNKPGKDGNVFGPSCKIINMSRTAALCVHDGMKKVLTGFLRDRKVRGESRTKVGRKIGVLTGSIYCNVPVVTVEMVFLSNKYDAHFISSTQGRSIMAAALASGIIEYSKRAIKD